MNDPCIVIIGGAQSGPTAAARARETNERARIVMLERAGEVSYAVGGLPYRLSGEVTSTAALDRERAEFFRDVYAVETRRGVEVKAIDAHERRVLLATLQGEESLGYTSLVYALGADSIMPTIPHLGTARNVFRFRRIADIEGILGRLDAGARRVAVLGGGFFGVEAVDGLLRRDCRVTVVERASALLPPFSPDIARVAAQALVGVGATVMTGIEACGVERSGEDVAALVLSNGQRLEVDVVIVAAGLKPRTELLARAGAHLLGDGTVAIDARCRTTLDDVYACGVCVSVPHAVSGRPFWLAQAAEADKTAQVAGTNAAGGKSRLPAALATAILRVGPLTLGRTGLTVPEAAVHAGTELAVTVVHAPTRDTFLPDADPITVQLLHHRSSGKLLGAEVVGGPGTDKRVDVLATAIRGGLTVDDLALLDLGYAPPYSSARDPVNVAGSVAAATRELATPYAAREVAAGAENLVLVDVRATDAQGAGTLAGALAMPLALVRAQLADLPPGKLVFFDESGRCGYLAARIARQRGREDAGFLAGGLRSWVQAGLPLARAEGDA